MNCALRHRENHYDDRGNSRGANLIRMPHNRRGARHISRRLLPEHHLGADTKDAVKLAMGLVATMSALVLGLLVTSVKGASTPGNMKSASSPLKSRLLTGC